MNNPISSQVAVYLPADVVARMEELKQDREEDRAKSVQQLVERFCRTYVDVLEGHRWELEHAEELNHAYSEPPEGKGDSDEWADVYPDDEEGRS